MQRKRDTFRKGKGNCGVLITLVFAMLLSACTASGNKQNTVSAKARKKPLEIRCVKTLDGMHNIFLQESRAVSLAVLPKRQKMSKIYFRADIGQAINIPMSEN